MVLEKSKIEVQDFVQLSIERVVVGLDGAIGAILHSRFDCMRRLGRVPEKIVVALLRIAMLRTERLPLTALARGKQVAVVELPVEIARLALPVLDLHRVRIGTDVSHAIAA